MDTEAPVEVKHELRVMGQSGDTHVVWDPNVEAEVANAKRTFDDLKRKRYNAYRVGDKGRKGEVMSEFDPEAGKIIMALPMQGG